MSLKQVMQQAIQQRWQIRCPHCGRSKPLLGAIRIGGGSAGKLAWCSQCHRLRWGIVERLADPAE